MMLFASFPAKIRRAGVMITFTLLYVRGFTQVPPVFVNLTVNMPPELIADAGPDKGICPGDSVLIGGSPTLQGGTGSVTFSWSPASGLSSASVQNPMAGPAATTLYTFSASDSRNCTARDSMQVRANALPVPAFTWTSNGLTVTFTQTTAGGVASSQWLFGDSSSSTAQDTVHTYAGAGSYQVCLTVVDSNGCSDSACQDITVQAVARETSDDADLFRISPNPFSSSCQIEANLTQAQVLHIEVTDLQGRRVELITDGLQEAGRHLFRFSPDAAGIYLVHIQAGNRIRTEKVIRQR